MAVSNTSGITYKEKGVFLRNETTSVYNFATTNLPESCFSFQVVATIGFGQGAGYKSIEDPTALFAVTGIFVSLLVISVLVNVYLTLMICR
ncbi:hypothetical protein CHS0354_015037 [Potamilus streckersoni]|uniref:Uncharacterized protein n=1 Tax=Potamilus streckersoni TaxID=2493646 RepID=A0AAE0TGJ7_9BIVA|nr:hypothetical protein CHS0354_015037 [Potamilus streckersoni]